MSYISVSEEEGAEPIEIPTEEDGTGETWPVHHTILENVDNVSNCLLSCVKVI